MTVTLLVSLGSTERWRDVVGHPGYLISSDGRVYSTYVSRVLRPGRTKNGYPNVVLAGRKCRYVHHLILEAFVGPAPAGHEAGHRDGNPSNSTLDNLRWVTKPQNGADRVAHGTSGKGEKNSAAKLTAEQVAHIRSNPENKSQGQLAKQFGVAKSTVGHAATGRTWAG